MNKKDIENVFDFKIIDRSQIEFKCNFVPPRYFNYNELGYEIIEILKKGKLNKVKARAKS